MPIHEPARGVVWADINGDNVMDPSEITDIGTARPDDTGDSWAFDINNRPEELPPAPPGDLSGGGAITLDIALAVMDFGDVTQCQAWLSTASDAEAFTCGCVLVALLTTQP